jgi:uncharacterized membrane protein
MHLLKRGVPLKKLARFFKTTLIGGVAVILPVLIILSVFKWLFDSIIERIEPITAFIVTSTQLQSILADSISVMIIIVICFLVGLLVRTRLGGFIYGFFEDKLLKKIPGYRMVKETVSQFFLGNKKLFTAVALVNLFDSDTMVTALITDEHPDGSFTVFLPTAPNPTSGNIFHVRGDRVHKLDISVEEAMKTVISCGVGSRRLIEQLFAQDRGPK